MRLNKANQYGILLALYLCRSGRARISDVAANLKMSKTFLEQIATKLREGGVITSFRGPNGGYELVDGSTVADVLNALGAFNVITREETLLLQTGQTEHRALANFVGAVSFNLTNLFNTKIAHVVGSLVTQELEQLNQLNNDATPN